MPGNCARCMRRSGLCWRSYSTGLSLRFAQHAQRACKSLSYLGGGDGGGEGGGLKGGGMLQAFLLLVLRSAASAASAEGDISNG